MPEPFASMEAERAGPARGLSTMVTLRGGWEAGKERWRPLERIEDFVERMDGLRDGPLCRSAEAGRAG